MPQPQAASVATWTIEPTAATLPGRTRRGTSGRRGVEHRLRAVGEINQAILDGVGVDTVFIHLAHSARTLVDADSVIVGTLQGDARDGLMLRAIEEHFPADARYTRPAGGLFVWAELPRHVDTRELLLDAVQERVAFVPGQGFHSDYSGTNTMRLNFSNVPPDQLREGVRRLGRAIQRRLAQAPSDSRVSV